MTASTFHERLELARKAVGISARQCDRLAGKAFGTCALLEKRAHDTKGKASGVLPQTAEAFAAALGVSLPWLLLGVGNEPEWASITRDVAERLKALPHTEPEPAEGPRVDRSPEFVQTPAGVP